MFLKRGPRNDFFGVEENRLCARFLSLDIAASGLGRKAPVFLLLAKAGRNTTSRSDEAEPGRCAEPSGPRLYKTLNGSTSMTSAVAGQLSPDAKSRARLMSCPSTRLFLALMMN